MNTNLSQAIEQSISQNERVTLTVEDCEAAYNEISAASNECDSATENDDSLDVWGTDDEGRNFRLHLTRG